MRPAFFYFFILLISCQQVTKVEVDSSWDFSTFIKPDQNPIVSADSTLTFFDPVSQDIVYWQRADVFNPGAVVRNDTVFLLLRCEDNPEAILGGRTSRIGLAYSTDGINFTKHPNPILFPDDDAFKVYDHPGGCEDPRVVETDDGRYIMVYTAWNYDIARLSVAISEDLYEWKKGGPAFAKAYNGRFLDMWSKSGSIITEMQNDQPIAKKRNGKYWMYWGEQFVNLAWSENLVDWFPMINPDSSLLKLIEPREGFFDSHLTECGPPAIITEEGVVLLYNGKNTEDERSDPTIPKGMYSVGKVVFDPGDLTTVISRTDSYLLKPTLPHEITGQYKSGTTFAEGLVFFKGRWFLYYGTADSYVGVATSP